MSELSLCTGALTPCLAATLGHKRLPWLLTAVEHSKTVVNKVEQTGFEGIPALVISVEEEGLQGLLQTVMHCVTQDKGLHCLFCTSLSCKRGIITHDNDTVGLNLPLCDPWMEGASNETISHRIRLLKKGPA